MKLAFLFLFFFCSLNNAIFAEEKQAPFVIPQDVAISIDNCRKKANNVCKQYKKEGRHIFDYVDCFSFSTKIESVNRVMIVEEKIKTTDEADKMCDTVLEIAIKKYKQNR